MAAISQFATAENYQKLQDALGQINTAIQEAELAKQAGIPNADQSLTAAQDTKARILQVLNTYFPSGTQPS